MKNLLISTLLLFATAGFSQSGNYKAEKLWETPDVLTTSESVCYDSANQQLFVSCIDGNPTEKDGNGFISQVSLSGQVIVFRWASNLNAPKGMGITNGFLYATDIDRVVKLNLEDGKLLTVFNVEDAKFLNDITIGPDGNVYISDMHSNNIHRIVNNRIELWVSNPILQSPNGLNYLGDEILVGTSNGIFAININDKAIRHLVKDTGGIDGLEIFEDGYFIISDWSGKVQLVHPERAPILLMNTTDEGINAADIEYIAEREMLLVPTFMNNKVMAYKIIKK